MSSMWEPHCDGCGREKVRNGKLDGDEFLCPACIEITEKGRQVLEQQLVEDTCTKHKKFLCPECFEVQVLLTGDEPLV